MPYCEKCGNLMSNDSKFCAKCGSQQNNNSPQSHSRQNPVNNAAPQRGELIACAYCDYNSIRRFKIGEIVEAIIAAMFWIFYFSDYEISSLFFAIAFTVISILFSYYGYVAKNCILQMYENCVSGKADSAHILKSFEVPYCNIADVRVIRKRKSNVLQLSIKNNFSNSLDVFSCYIVDPYEIMKQIQTKINQ